MSRSRPDDQRPRRASASHVGRLDGGPHRAASRRATSSMTSEYMRASVRVAHGERRRAPAGARRRQRRSPARRSAPAGDPGAAAASATREHAGQRAHGTSPSPNDAPSSRGGAGSRAAGGRRGAGRRGCRRAAAPAMFTLSASSSHRCDRGDEPRRAIAGGHRERPHHQERRPRARPGRRTRSAATSPTRHRARTRCGRDGIARTTQPDVSDRWARVPGVRSTAGTARRAMADACSPLTRRPRSPTSSSSAPVPPASPPRTSWQGRASPARSSRPTTSSAASAAPSSATAGASTSAATASSPRCPRSRPSGTRSSPDDDFLQRPRMSRIYYQRQVLRLPARGPSTRCSNLGLDRGRALRALVRRGCASGRRRTRSTSRAGSRPASAGASTALLQDLHREGLGASRPTEISADWAAQRIKNLSLWQRRVATLQPLPRRKPEGHHHPDRGVPVPEVRPRDDVGALPRARSRPPARKVAPRRHRWRASSHEDGRAVAVVADTGGTGPPCPRRPRHLVDAVPAPAARHGPAGAGRGARRPPTASTYRDFLTVALVVPRGGTPSPTTGSTSTRPTVQRRPHPELRLVVAVHGEDGPHLPRASSTSCSRATTCWYDARRRPDRPRQARSSSDARPRRSPSGSRPATSCGCRRRTRSTTSTYRANVERAARAGSTVNAPNVHPVGRNGMHKYNNQDHSMFTAMLTVENILAAPTTTSGR